MFERNPVDAAALMAVAVELTMKDGSVVTGKAGLPHARGVARLLDGPEAFLFVETFEGEVSFVPKAEIRGVKVIDTGRAQPLRMAAADATSFDPYKVLDLPRGASLDDIKAAYHKMTRLYHPDAYAGVTLPAEVRAYFDARCKQINAAFALLKSPRKAMVG